MLGAVWAIVTVLRRKSTRRSAIFVAFVDLGFVGALIAGVYVLRGISKANCAHFESSRDFYISLDNDGFSGQSPFSFSLNKSCAMLKAAFALGIMNIIFFFITSCLLLFMHRSGDKEVVVKETYTSRRRSHDSRLVFSLFKLEINKTNNNGTDVAILAVDQDTTEALVIADGNTTYEMNTFQVRKVEKNVYYFEDHISVPWFNRS